MGEAETQTSEPAQALTEETVVVSKSKGGIRTRAEKNRLQSAVQLIICCFRSFRRLSPCKFVRGARDSYVSALNGCSSRCVFQTYGMGLGMGSSCSAGLRVTSVGPERSEACWLSPGFKKAFNDLNSRRNGTGSFYSKDSEGLALREEYPSCPFKRSFSEYESCLSPTMKKTYNEAATGYSPRSSNSFSSNTGSREGYSPRSSNSFSSNTSGRDVMLIFPIEETPEHKAADLPSAVVE